MATPARHIVTTLTLAALFLSAQGGILARVMFEIRQETIATHHCENRFDPNSTCDGFCFLKKHLSEHEKHDQERQQVVTPVSIVFFYLPAGTIRLPSPTAEARFVHAPEGPGLTAGFHARIEHPPRMA